MSNANLSMETKGGMVYVRITDEDTGVSFILAEVAASLLGSGDFSMVQVVDGRADEAKRAA